MKIDHKQAFNPLGSYELDSPEFRTLYFKNDLPVSKIAVTAAAAFH